MICKSFLIRKVSQLASLIYDNLLPIGILSCIILDVKAGSRCVLYKCMAPTERANCVRHVHVGQD